MLLSDSHNCQHSQYPLTVLAHYPLWKPGECLLVHRYDSNSVTIAQLAYNFMLSWQLIEPLAIRGVAHRDDSKEDER